MCDKTMVEFGKRLKDACAEHGLSWAVHCIAYNDLKFLIENKKQAAGADTDDAAVLSQHELFRYALDREIGSHRPAPDVFLPYGEACEA